MPVGTNSVDELVLAIVAVAEVVLLLMLSMTLLRILVRSLAWDLVSGMVSSGPKICQRS